MRTAAGVSISLLVTAALAQTASPQGRARASAADAGSKRARTPGPILLGTDPPGKLRPYGAAADAGTPLPRIAAPDDVQRELQQLRGRVEALEQERGQLQQQSQQLQEVMRQLQQVRTQLSEREQRTQAAEERRRTQREEGEAGLSALREAQARLASGDSAVEEQLAQAQAAFPPLAQRDLEAARMALRNRDLSAARAYLGAAMLHAQQGQ